MSTLSADGGMSRKLLALSGAVFVVGAVAAIVVLGGDTPDGDASAAKVSSFYQAHQNRQNLAAFVLAASVPLLIFFGVSLTSAVWPSQPGRRPVWAGILGAGTVLAAGAFALSAFIHFALADSADNVTAAVSQGLNALDADTWIAFNSCLGVMMFGAAGSLIPATDRYRIMGWIALPLGIALLIPFADFFALLLTAIWIIVASVMLYRRAPAMA